ncbi:TetR family transcriptional regulator [Keratinibaculum paraultunense]|uniref:TetR family transcriptional regulator n=1 Tax=Keratinibaculum paraultunense TaxID=1278232 RepID=A0A4R3KX49_9FIRM|nr:TetR/AcrR family transcriptional regulator [Keratinibaculum paraultunense]QQY79268.1 TetR/AcrR family transcriptional regulator [Keratinibaculum paraultunense]TCS89400.1 TetR family transcriptional regulator [Keratinibaculum paraultunense]
MPKQRFFNLPDSKKEKIIDTAYDMFIEMDYEDVTIRALAKAFDISIGSFYQYFHDKDDLYLYLMSTIEKKIYAAHEQKYGYFLMDPNVIPIEDICTQKEIEFNRTWYRAPVEVMMKFYFNEYSKDLNSNVMKELIELKNSGKLKDSVDIDFIFHIYATSMFNILMYFRENNITDENQKIDLKTKFYTDWFLRGILK